MQDVRMKVKEGKKLNKYPDLARRQKKLWKMKVSVISIVLGALEIASKNLGKTQEELEIRGWNNPDHSIIKIGKDSWKSPEDLKRLTVTQTPVKKQKTKQKHLLERGNLLGVVNCDIVVSEFELQSRYYIPFRTLGKVWSPVVVMPRTILPRRNRRCALSATGTRKPEEEKDARGVTYFMEENVISPREVERFNEHIRN